MKKAISMLICVLFLLTILCPVGVIITACLGYRFELISVPGFAIVIAVLSVWIVVLDFVYIKTFENHIIQVLVAMITPLSLINAVFYIFECPQIWVIASLLISAGCCCYLTVRYGKPLKLKIIALVLSALMISPICFFGFIALIFGNLGENTVVQRVESPNGELYAQVINSDQGALGGDTIVNVYEKIKIDAILFKIEKNPQTVYVGEWGEFENMQIRWKDDHCLLIDRVEYEIE